MINISARQHEFESASPQTILRWGVERFGMEMAVVTSFQKTGIVTLHMMQDIAPKIPVLTVDTGNLFPETYAFIDEVEALFNLNLHRIYPAADAQSNQWEYDIEGCCHTRKVIPLKHALESYQAWIAGVRRDQGPSRANAPIIKLDPGSGLVKLAPFANWTAEMIDLYIATHDLPVNPLHAQGYPSIGCVPCTRPVEDGEDVRAGRWAGTNKTECGIHLHAS